MLRPFMTGILILLPTFLLAQKTDVDGKMGARINFHVTSVRYEDDPSACPIAACSAKKFTVEGYADGATGIRIAYVLTCDELVAFKPTTHVAISCGSVHANNDYDARLFG